MKKKDLVTILVFFSIYVRLCMCTNVWVDVGSICELRIFLCAFTDVSWVSLNVLSWGQVCLTCRL